jgi:VanZ family protein
MALLSSSSGYRIGRMPTRLATPPGRQALWATGLGVVVIALLIGLVMVLNQAVVRGSEIRAALAKPAGAKLAHMTPRAPAR